jgi:uncharacterized protein DUF5362
VARYRYETRAARARRDIKQTAIAHICVGLFLCLTIIGAPVGIIVLIVGIREYRKSSAAVDAYERVTAKKAEEKWIRDLRRM